MPCRDSPGWGLATRRRRILEGPRRCGVCRRQSGNESAPKDRRMNYRDSFYPEARFGGFTDIDGTIAFFNRVNSLVGPSSVVLDVGCGRGASSEDPVPLKRNLRVLKGRVARVIGIDVDKDARLNPSVDEFRLIRGDGWPVDSNSVDLVICDNVLEHVEFPDRFLLEVARVLRDGGHVCIRTLNRHSYVGWFATVIPTRYHARVTSAVQDERQAEDVFPTLYRCNTIPRLRRSLQRSGFDCAVYGYEAEPSYLSFSKTAYRLGVLHQRFAPRFLRPAIFAFGRITKTA